MEIFRFSVVTFFFSISETNTLSSSKIDIFLANLLSQQFSECSLFFVQDRNDNYESLTYIVQKSQLNYYNIKYSYPLDSDTNSVNSNLNPYNRLPGNLTSDINSDQNRPVTFGISVANYNKRNNPCKVNLLMITDLRPDFMIQINKMVTPVYIPITKKDVDYFIFITQPKLMDKLLLMPEFPGKIKFKIAIGASEFKDSNKDLVIKSVCFFCGENGSPKIVEYPESGIVEYFPDFVKNLNGKVLRVSCPGVTSRIETFGPPWEGLKNTKRGMWKPLFEEFLMIKFNFTYNMFLSMGKEGNIGRGGTGFKLPNGTWIGVVGDLVAGKADLGIVTAITVKRIHEIDFTNSFYDITFLALYTSEAPKIYSPLALLWPFDIFMWICIFLSTLLAFFIFACISKFFKSVADRDTKPNQSWGIKTQIFFILATYLDQDAIMPRFQPLRCFVAFWLFFTLVLTTVYRSKLVTLLAFPVIEKLPQTFEDLAYSDYEVGFMKQGDAAYSTLKASTDPVYVKLVKEMEIITGAGLECLQRVVTRKYGCIGYDVSLSYLKARNVSDFELRNLVAAPATTFNIYMGLATEGGSIYKHNFDKWLRHTRAFHLANIWEDRDFFYNVRLPKRAWWLASNQTDKLSKTIAKESSDLTMKNISGAFYILIICLVLSLFVFLEELVRFWFYRREVIKKRVRLCWQRIRGRKDKALDISLRISSWTN